MARIAVGIVLLVLVGCHTCEPPTYVRRPDTSDPWNTNYLIDADPDTVTISDVHSRAVTLTEHYWTYSQVNGILWPAWRTDPALTNPDRWINGGDTGLYTGQALAAFALEYGTSHSNASLQRVMDTLRGLYILTHSTGTPGVVQRCAFPADQPAKFGYPAEWGGRSPDFVSNGPPMDDPYGGPQIPSQTYYTRGTKDQLTGMVLGLAAVWTVTKGDSIPATHIANIIKVRKTTEKIARAIYLHLKKYDWNIRDQNGKNDTSADHVDDLLRAVVLGLQVHMGNTVLQEEYDKVFNWFMDISNTIAYGDQFSNYQQYFAHNLRASRALALWLLEGGNSQKGRAMSRYMARNVWKFTKGHQAAWFAFTQATLNSDAAAAEEGVASLKSLSLKPIRMWSSPYVGQEKKPGLVASLTCHRNYVLPPHLRKPEDFSTWQKEPWDPGKGDGWDKKGLGNASGVDYLLSYWLAQYGAKF